MEANRTNAQNTGNQGGAGRTDKQDAGQQKQGAPGEGRVRDISEIDQQEGNMHHGTLGGNFDTAGQEGEEQDNNR